MIRCCNIDWLEVYCFETGVPHLPDYFRDRGLVVVERDFGTRVYNQMFTVCDSEGTAFVEVRRKPKNPLIVQESTHLRLVNRSCYYPDAAKRLQKFMDEHGYVFQRVSRVDICLDFTRFDDNTLPRVFMQRYMRGKFSKINQSRIHSHGSDTWTGRVWNSVSWGAPSSMISTKFYNKTLELYDPKTDSYGKPWIRYAWLKAGLIDDMERCSLHGETQEIWRLEFSIRSAVKGWFVIERDGQNKAYQSIRSDLSTYDSPDKLLCIFASLTRHYFHFKRYIPEQRKDRCPDRVLFRWDGLQQFVEIDRQTETMPSQAPPSLLLKLVRRIRVVLDSHSITSQVRALLEEILRLLQPLILREEFPSDFSREQELALQLLMKRRSQGEVDATLSAVLNDIKRILKINDLTAVF